MKNVLLNPNTLFDYLKKKITQQTEAWESDPLREQHPSMPMNNDRQSRVSFGGGNKKPS